jgi:hypothetical protein
VHLDTHGLRIEIALPLVEEAVLLKVDSGPSEDRRRFHAERDPLYEIRDAEEREAAFGALHGRWFRALGIGGALSRLPQDDPAVARRISRCLVIPAAGPDEQGADLHDPREAVPRLRGPEPALPVLVLRLASRTLLDPAALAALLRREMIHVADMLDPAFGYERGLDAPGEDPARVRILRDRYRLLWSITVDARMAAVGLLDPSAADRRLREFAAAFPDAAEGGGDLFRRLVTGPRPSHRELLALAAGAASPAVHVPSPARRSGV